MRLNGGQALLELALCAPIVVILAVSVAAVVQLEDASAGLDAATQAAVSAAARGLDPASAVVAADSRFAAVAAGYPLREATLRISLGTFSRAGEVTATSRAFADIGWAGLVLPHRLELRSRAAIRLEPWRTHRPSM